MKRFGSARAYLARMRPFRQLRLSYELMKSVSPTGSLFRTTASACVCLLAAWAVVAMARPALSKTKSVEPRRIYKTDEPSLLDISSDGHFILTAGHRHIECGNRKCEIRPLVVYQTDTGRRVSELLPDRQEESAFLFPANFLAGHFAEGFHVRAVEARFIPTDKKYVFKGIQWDSNRNTSSTFVLPKVSEDFQFACGIDNGELLGVVLDKPPRHSRLAITDQGHLRELQQPSFPFAMGVRSTFWWLLGANCTAYRSQTSYLLANGDAPGSSLYWVSLEAAIPPRLCRIFSDDVLNGYAVSPDGTLIAAITSEVQPQMNSRHQSGRQTGPPFHAFLNVLDSRTCDVLKRSELEFPEGRSEWKSPLIRVRNSVDLLDNFHFGDQFAKQLAISPDNSKLALAYGHFKSPDGIAFFGLYSLRDGHRMTTFQGETYKAGLLHGTLVSDAFYAETAPITGHVQFSPDSKYLYASSKYIFQWDVSGLN